MMTSDHLQPPRPHHAEREASGEAESLWGRISLADLGSRASREPLPKARRGARPSPGVASAATVDFVAALVAEAVDGQPEEVVQSALEDTVRTMQTQALSDQGRKAQVDAILGTVLSLEKYTQLANLCAKLPPATGGDRTAISDALAVDFGASDGEDGRQDEDDDVIGVLLGDDAGSDQDSDRPVLVEEDAEGEGLLGRRRLNLKALEFSLAAHTMTNRGCDLPDRTVRVSGPGYEEIQIPAPPAFLPNPDALRPVRHLPAFYQPAFASAGIASLNYIQSAVLDTIVASPDSVLLCAPTGAGKTNVALLAILREAEQLQAALADFKAVYLAPMRALVQEMVRALADRLAPYGLRVAELTGESATSRAELAAAHVIVATPEKWDVVSRKANDLSHTRLVRLMIVDEIHLLHDERGPVLEAVIMRIRRGGGCRLIGLSATLPNYRDVARFIGAEPRSTFWFDAGHRPCPLAQVLVGVHERRPLQRMRAMDEACYRLVAERAGRHQCLVFVHSRRDTVRTARSIVERAVADGTIGKFLVDAVAGGDAPPAESDDLAQLLKYGLAVHHAGLSRADRALVEAAFADGRVQLLVSTATLAWGVNLPAHTVILKGTQVYRPDRGVWAELSPQDVLQMLGRAGRPQYDREGEGIIITEQAELPFYLTLSTLQLPIESQLISRLPDHLNAEIAGGSVGSLAEAVAWLRRSYLAIRMHADPACYGLAAGDGAAGDGAAGDGAAGDGAAGGLVEERLEDLAHAALLDLQRAGLVEYERSPLQLPGAQRVGALELGRIASAYYVPLASARVYSEHCSRPFNLAEIDLLRIVSLSSEFALLPVRREERLEVQKLLERVPIPAREAADDRLAKVNVLLQAWISRVPLAGFALQADALHVTRQAARMLRALFEIALSRGLGMVARTALGLALAVEHRQWPVMTPLRQLAGRFGLSEELLGRLERKDFSFDRLFDLGPEELGDLVRQPTMGPVLFEALQAFPRLAVEASVRPIGHDLLHLELTVSPKWALPDQSPGPSSELFWVLVEGGEEERCLVYDQVIFTDKAAGRPAKLTLQVPLPAAVSPPPVLFLTVMSDRWLGAETRLPIALMALRPPDRPSPATVLEDRRPLVVTLRAGGGAEEERRLSALETHAADAVEAVAQGRSAFLALPSGCPRRALLELAVVRAAGPQTTVLWLHPVAKYVARVIGPLAEALLAGDRCPVRRLSGDPQVDLKLLGEENDAGRQGARRIVIGTTSEWEVSSRRWRSVKRALAGADLLVIVEDVHLLADDPVLELLLARLRFVRSAAPGECRLLAISESLLNGHDLGEWLVGPEGCCLAFPANVLPRAIAVHPRPQTSLSSLVLSSLGACHERLFPRDGAAARPRRSLVFVDDWRQARQTALDLTLFSETERVSSASDRSLADRTLQQTMPYSIAYLHESLSDADSRAVLEAWRDARSDPMCILVARDSLYAFDLPGLEADQAILLGTSRFDPARGAALEWTPAELARMYGCGRQVGVYCRRPVALRYSDHPRLSVESALDADSLPAGLNAAVAARTVASKQEAVDLLTWTLLYRRLPLNPHYYGLALEPGVDAGEALALAISVHLSDLVEESVRVLVEAQCLSAEDVPGQALQHGLLPLDLGLIAAHYGVHWATVDMMALSATRGTRLRGVLELVTAALEFDPSPLFPLRSGRPERRALERLAEAVPLRSPSCNLDDAHVRAGLLLQAHLSRIGLPADLAIDLEERILPTALKLAFALFDVLASRGWLAAAGATADFAQSLVQAMWPHQHPLWQVPFLGQAAIDRAEAAGIRSLYDFVDLEEDAPIRRDLFEGLSRSELKQAVRAINRYPSLTVASVRFIAGEEPGSGQVLAVIERDTDEPRVLAPHLPFAKDELWWVIAGAGDVLLSVRKTALAAEVNEVRLTGLADRPDRLLLLCDSYVGCDREIEIEIEVGDSPAEQRE